MYVAKGKSGKIGWKIFKFFFPPVRIEYLHENIQGKEVKNGNFSAKFKKKQPIAKKKNSSEQLQKYFSLYLNKIFLISFSTNYYSPLNTPKTPSGLENILRNSPKKIPLKLK